MSVFSDREAQLKLLDSNNVDEDRYNFALGQWR
jgi:hypothetical protein